MKRKLEKIKKLSLLQENNNFTEIEFIVKEEK